MSEQHIVREAMRFLMGLEEGRASTADLYTIALDLDGVLIHWAIRYLRDKYPASNPSAKGVAERMLELSSNHPEIVKKAKDGEGDIVSEWFEETHDTAEFFNDPETLMTTLVEKLEG